MLELLGLTPPSSAGVCRWVLVQIVSCSGAGGPGQGSPVSKTSWLGPSYACLGRVPSDARDTDNRASHAHGSGVKRGKGFGLGEQVPEPRCRRCSKAPGAIVTSERMSRSTPSWRKLRCVHLAPELGPPLAPSSNTVSVVIPSHNRRHLLRRCLATVLAQENVDVEVLVCDDGSTDGTADAVAAIADPRLRVVRRERPHGVSAARNLGIAESSGQWVAFLDDDDLWAPNKLSLQIAALEAADREWSCAGSVAIDAADSRILRGRLPLSAHAIAAALPFHNAVPGGASSVVARRSTLDETGGFDLDLRHLADWDMWIRLSARGDPAVVNQPVVAITQHGGNASLDTRDILRELRTIEQRYGEMRGGKPIDSAYVYRWVGFSALRAGNRLRAVGAYGRAAIAGDRQAIVRAAGALVVPRKALSRRQSMPEEWRLQAEAWLAPLRSPSPPHG